MKNVTPLKPREYRKPDLHPGNRQLCRYPAICPPPRRRPACHLPALDAPPRAVRVASMTESKYRHYIHAALLLLLTTAATTSLAASGATQGVPHGSPAKAVSYYTNLAAVLEFRDAATITNST